ncbi:MAG: EndoU domain-containing protein [Candidatus Dormiibacterota bacterium]
MPDQVDAPRPSAPPKSPSVVDFVEALPEPNRELARHVLLGTFNRWGDPVGFHHAPGRVPPPGRHIDRILKTFDNGAYVATVSFYDPERGWVEKPHPTTMFPDRWTSEDVMRAGREAYALVVHRWESDVGVNRPWSATGGRMPIAGRHRRDRPGPATFYPKEHAGR